MINYILGACTGIIIMCILQINKVETKEDYLKRINYFGIKEQKRKFGEESDELKEAITEYEILKEYVGGAKMKKLKEHIAEEIADNLSLLKQFQLFYEIKDDEIKKWLKFKNERTNERIKTKYYE